MSILDSEQYDADYQESCLISEIEELKEINNELLRENERLQHSNNMKQQLIEELETDNEKLLNENIRLYNKIIGSENE